MGRLEKMSQKKPPKIATKIPDTSSFFSRRLKKIVKIKIRLGILLKIPKWIKRLV